MNGIVEDSETPIESALAYWVLALAATGIVGV